MITEITNNPFRILGLPANAKREEIDQCYQVLKDGLEQQGTEELYLNEIEEAYKAVTSPEYHWCHALYWFVSLSSKDERAIQFVEEENYIAASEIWEETISFASSHNLMLCYLLMGETAVHYYAKAFYHARNFFLFDSDFNAFVECVHESNKSATNEALLFLDKVFSQTTADKTILYTFLGHGNWMEHVRGKWIDADWADAKMKQMQDWIEFREVVKEEKAKEESRQSILKWIWILIFPIILVAYHIHKNEKQEKNFNSFKELMNPNAERYHPSKPIQIDITDSVTFNKVNEEMKNMRKR